jgi:hypothetical protein
VFNFFLCHGDLKFGFGFGETLVVGGVEKVLGQATVKVVVGVHDEGAEFLVCLSKFDVGVELQVSDKGLLLSSEVGLVSVLGLLETVVVAVDGVVGGHLEAVEGCF